MIQLLKILITLTLLISCGTSNNINENKRLKDIILVNTSGEKCEVAQIIDLIDRCNPKVVGLNLLFSDNTNSVCDKKLIDAIELSGKIILVEGLYDSLSDETFYLKAKYTGETGLSRHDSDSSTNFYYRLSPFTDLRFSFPYLIAHHYDKSKGAMLASQSFRKQNQLMFYHQTSDFKILTIDNISKNCNTLSDKIVLIGQMNENASHLRYTEFKNNDLKELNVTVLQANIILDILNDLDNKKVTINRYADHIRQQQMNKD